MGLSDVIPNIMLDNPKATEIPEALVLGFRLASAAARSLVRNGDPGDIFAAAIVHTVDNFALEALTPNQFPLVYSKNSTNYRAARQRSEDLDKLLVHPDLVLSLREIRWLQKSSS
ncbi:hypothetical protein C8J56DRAFT_1050000 [Mycena floridula]|nr:hypothetical protein C8J56DRAFT_1050000 [Mycena floridula]